MAMTIHVDIVSAEKAIFSGKAEMVYAETVSGEVGIAPRHTQLIAQMRPGEVRLHNEGKQDEMFWVSGGILEVQPHQITVLADTAERADDLDEARAKEAIERAEKAMADKKSSIDFAKAQAELAEAMAQLRVI
ncbi:MAG: F0F1 ATP synthase subunit epsilon, partial [Gammaproteobacteria bacterium]